MKNLLLPHNAAAYEKVAKMFEDEQHVCVVHATGTGKSYLSAQLLKDNPNSKTLYISPVDLINKQFQTILDEYNIKSNISYSNYTGLLNLKNLKIETIQKEFGDIDQIILDEFHRCGAIEWSKGLNKLFEAYPDAKIFGTSATEIRYLDDQRNMANELFHGNVASRIPLSKAIREGILPTSSKYINAIYSLVGDVEDLQSKINKVTNKKEKSRLQKLLDQAKSTIEEAGGLPQIFKKYVDKKDSKFIVFCRDINHMQKVSTEIDGWFKHVNSTEKYFVHSGLKTNQATLDDFSNSNSDKIKLLFSVALLNEGIHVDGIDGVIMLRKTNSMNIFLQQLGRALSAGGKNPTIFDIANNIVNSKINNKIAREVKGGGNGGDYTNDNEILDDFEIHDDFKNIRDLLEELDGELSNKTWNEMFEIYKRYIQKTGNANPATTSLIYKKVNLGTWINTQRQNYRDGILCPERAEKLSKLGLILDNVRDENWAIAYSKFESEMRNGKLSEESRIWWNQQKNYYRKGILSQGKIEMLESAGGKFDFYTSWNEMFDRIKQKIDTRAELDKDEKNWISAQRAAKKSGTLSKKSMEKLRHINIDLEPQRKAWLDASWNKHYDLINQALDDGVTPIPSALLSWKSRNIIAMENGELSPEQEAKMRIIIKKHDEKKQEDIKKTTKAFRSYQDERSNAVFDEAVKRLLEHLNSCLETGNKVEGKYFVWISHQNVLIKNGDYPKERIEKFRLVEAKYYELLSLIEQKRLDKKYEKACESFASRLQECEETGQKIEHKYKAWKSKQCVAFREGNLSPVRLKILQSFNINVDLETEKK